MASLDPPWWNKSNHAQQELDQSDFYYFDQKNALLLSSKKNHEKNHAYPTDSKQIFHIVNEEILSSTAFVTEWTSRGYCFVFWLIFLVSSPPSLTTIRFAHASSMNTSLGEFSRFPMSSISIQSSSSSTTFFSEGLFFSIKA